MNIFVPHEYSLVQILISNNYENPESISLAIIFLLSHHNTVTWAEKNSRLPESKGQLSHTGC